MLSCCCSHRNYFMIQTYDNNHKPVWRAHCPYYQYVGLHIGVNLCGLQPCFTGPVSNLIIAASPRQVQLVHWGSHKISSLNMTPCEFWELVKDDLQGKGDSYSKTLFCPWIKNVHITQVWLQNWRCKKCALFIQHAKSNKVCTLTPKCCCKHRFGSS